MLSLVGYKLILTIDGGHKNMTTILSEKQIRTYLKNVSQATKDELVVKLLSDIDAEFIRMHIKEFNDMYGGAIQ